MKLSKSYQDGKKKVKLMSELEGVVGSTAYGLDTTNSEILIDVSDHRDIIFEAGQEAVDDPERYRHSVTARIAVLDTMGSVLRDSPDIDNANKILYQIRTQHG